MNYVASIKSHQHAQRKSHFVIFNEITLKSISKLPYYWTSKKCSFSYSQGSLPTHVGRGSRNFHDRRTPMDS